MTTPNARTTYLLGLRLWAAQRAIPVPDHGAIPAETLAAYDDYLTGDLTKVVLRRLEAAGLLMDETDVAAARRLASLDADTVDTVLSWIGVSR